MVFDPSLFKKPVTVAEWIVKMSADGEVKAHLDKVYYGSRYQYYPRRNDFNRVAWSPIVLKTARKTAEKYRPLQDMTVSASGQKTLSEKGSR